ncbi:MAG: 4-alpha-glucanotransferase, partial [Bryobacteraceae bacterium]
LQDLLNLGREARMNVPGRAGGNWRWRYTGEMLTDRPFARLLDLTANCKRLPDAEILHTSIESTSLVKR